MNEFSDEYKLIDELWLDKSTNKERQTEPIFYCVNMYCNDPWEGSSEWIWIYRKIRDTIETIITNCDHIIGLDDAWEYIEKYNIRILYTTTRIHDILWLSNTENYWYSILDSIDIFILEQKGVKVVVIESLV